MKVFLVYYFLLSEVGQMENVSLQDHVKGLSRRTDGTTNGTKPVSLSLVGIRLSTCVQWFLVL